MGLVTNVTMFGRTLACGMPNFEVAFSLKVFNFKPYAEMVSKGC
jgi:hypothetical protein